MLVGMLTIHCDATKTRDTDVNQQGALMLDATLLYMCGAARKCEQQQRHGAWRTFVIFLFVLNIKGSSISQRNGRFVSSINEF